LLETTIIRMCNGALFWYPPGSDQKPQPLVAGESEELLQQLTQASRSGVCFAAPGTDITLLQVGVSAAEKKHIAKSLPFMLEEQLVSDVSELHFATAEIDKAHLCAAVCSHENMRHWLEALSAVQGINRWIPEPLLLPWRPGEWTVVIEEGYAIVRTGPCDGFSIERELLPDLLVAALESAPESPRAVIVYGDDQAGDRQAIPQSLHDCLQWRGGDLRAAMMLKGEDGAPPNLLQGVYARRLPLERWWLQWRKVAAVFALAFCLHLIADYSSYLSLSQENLALRQEIESAARKVIPRGALQKPELQIRRKLDALRGTAQTSGFVQLISRVGEIVSNQPETAISSINYNGRGGEIRMNITAPDFEAVEAIRNSLSENGLAAVMENSATQGDGVRARLRVGEGS
jgi:general secretion pathway protein L